MAIKADRVELVTDITMTCDTATNRGVTLTNNTAGSGVALGDSAGVATLSTNPSGQKVAGLLMNDVVNYDTTKYHGNFHKDETRINQRCRLLRKGRVTLDNLYGSATPAYGGVAYLGASGLLTDTVDADGGVAATPPVGEFKGVKDESGFVTVDIELPYTS